MTNIGADGNATDRMIGEYWEDAFIAMARNYGWEAWPFNRVRGATFTDEDGNRYVSPDVWVLRRQYCQYVCEIKHKNLAKNDCYGFELYRETSMLAIESHYTNQFGGVVALYVVHNHDLAGGKKAQVNNPLHWHAERLSFLAHEGHAGKPQPTYYNGAVTAEAVPMKYYPYRLFRPLQYFLQLPGGNRQREAQKLVEEVVNENQPCLFAV